MKKSSSILGAATQTLQSFDKTKRDSETKDEADTALDMTEDELAMFNDTKPLVNSSAEEESIVVRYSNPVVMLEDEPAEPGYATVNEIVSMEKKKEKKMERKTSKSLQKAQKSNNGTNSNKAQGISGPEMGFKPQFHSNPLMKLGGSIPPTPPPTPATVASIAPSDERKSTLIFYCINF